MGVIKPKCIICKKELKEAIVIPSSFEMLVNFSLPICEECKKRKEDKLNNKEVVNKNYNTLNIGPKREDSYYRFVQWQNHHSNIQEIKNLLDKANKIENELHFTLSEITLILQNYTTVKIQVDWVTSDKAVISWEDKINKHKTIPVEYFLEAIKTVRPDRDKLTKNDLRNLFRKKEADKLNNKEVENGKNKDR